MITSRGNPELIAKLEQEPEPILFRTYDEIRIWFESIWRKQIDGRLSTPYSNEEYAFFEAIKVISSQGDVTLVSLLRPDEKLKIKKYADEHKVKSESNILRGLSHIFGTNHKPNVNEWNYSNGNVQVAFSEISYEYLNESEMFVTEDFKDHSEIANLSLKGWAAYNYLGLLSFPNKNKKTNKKKNKYANELGMTLCKLYGLPLPESHQFIAYKILVYYDFTVMVEPKEWDELKRILKAAKLHRILPKYPDYYYNLRPWDRHNNLLEEIEDVIKNESIKNNKANQYRKDLIKLRQSFREKNELDFNYRNPLIYERAPFFYGLILKDLYIKHFDSIKEDIQYLIKTRHIADLKEKVKNCLSYAMVLVNLYYDLEKALSPESGKAGGQYKPPKEAIADYILKVYEITMKLGISHPRYWTLLLLNSFVNTCVYSETRFDEEPLESSGRVKQAFTSEWARKYGFILHGEPRLKNDIQLAQKKLRQ